MNPDLSSLWLFLIREYSESQGVVDAMKALFVKYSESFLNLTTPDELSKFINIIEEYILADVISYEDYINIVKIMEDKYELVIKVLVPTEGVFNLKSALLSLMSTLLLKILNRNASIEVKTFEKMLTFLLRELVNDFFDSEFKSIRPFKVSMLTLINRFIILSRDEFIDLLNSNFFFIFKRFFNVIRVPNRIAWFRGILD